ncbi:MAG: twin-arginine translocase TatA/TatE family subunit [Thermoleophilia bacterium]
MASVLRFVAGGLQATTEESLMGGLGWQHLLIVLAIVLVLFGGSRLPGLGKSLGESIRGFKTAIKDDEDETKKVDPGDKPSDGTGV